MLSCKHEVIYPDNYGYTGSPYINPKPTVNHCSPDTVYFQNQVLPYFLSYCKKCHLNFDSYSTMFGFVVPGNLEQSTIYYALTQDGMPLDHAQNPEQINMIKTWILQGAKNNKCDFCDTNTFTFSESVFPVIQANCTGCHSGANPSGKITFSTYADIKAIAVNGKLICTTTHGANCHAMPPYGLKLDDCKITQIKKWINNGAKND